MINNTQIMEVEKIEEGSILDLTEKVNKAIAQSDNERFYYTVDFKETKCFYLAIINRIPINN